MNDAINPSNNALTKFVACFNIAILDAPERIIAKEYDDENVLEYLNTGYRESYATDRTGIVAFASDMANELVDPIDQDSEYTEKLLKVLAHFGYRA